VRCRRESRIGKQKFITTGFIGAPILKMRLPPAAEFIMNEKYLSSGLQAEFRIDLFL
jgi:hypothetical protein